MNGIVEAHYLKCPYCGDRANLRTHRCMTCGALAQYVVWKHDTPELAMIARSSSERETHAR